MKVYLRLFTLCLISLILSCKGREDAKLMTISTQFLNNYFELEYKKAAEFCSQDLEKDLEESAKNYDSLDPKIRESIKLHSSDIKFEVLDLNFNKKRDSAIVNYRVLLPSFPNGIQSSLYFSKIDKQWVIYSFTK